MANNDDPIILSEEPSKVRINIQDPNKPKSNAGGKMIQKEKKIPFWDRVVSAFFGKDVNTHNVGKYLVDEWAVPTGLKMLNNGIQSTLKRTGDAAQVMLFGRVVNSNSGPVDYTSYSKPNGNVASPGGYRVTEHVDVFAFTNKSKAEECLTYLRGRIQTYKSVGVLDYFEWINDNVPGVEIPLDYNMANRGWVDLSNVTVMPDPNGFIINLPNPVFLKKG